MSPYDCCFPAISVLNAGTGAYCCNQDPDACCYYMWSFWCKSMANLYFFCEISNNTLDKTNRPYHFYIKHKVILLGFWMVWLLLFTLLITCGFWCRRRYHYRREYILVRQPNSVTQTGPNGTVTVYGTVEGATAYAAATSVPTAPMV